MKIRRRKKQNKKGQIVVWLFALLFLFMISLVYIIMTKPFITIHDMFAGNFTGTVYEPTFDKIRTFWVLWPILVIIGVFIWAILSSMRSNPNFPQL